jgi:hypothetical protein
MYRDHTTRLSKERKTIMQLASSLTRTTAPSASTLTRRLLQCGAVAGPLFLGLVLLQDYTRPGFDPRHDPLSLLSLGSGGWLQIGNFVLAGVLNLLFAVGLWRRLHPGRAGTWGPLLLGGYGLGLVLVGVCVTDPVNGFPLGSIAATQPSWHGAVHALGGLVVFVMLASALAVFCRYFLARHEWRWAAYLLVSALLLLVLFFAGFTNAEFVARTLRLATGLGWMASSLVAVKVLRTPEVRER